MTTMSAITGGEVLRMLKKLLRGKDAMDVSGWAHLVDDKYPWARPYHYQKYRLSTEEGLTDDQKCEKLELLTDSENCPDSQCLVEALKGFYSSLVLPVGDPKRVNLK